MKFSAISSALAVASLAIAKPIVQRDDAAASTDIDTTILQYALTLEHLEAAFYSEALGKFTAADFKAAGYPDFVRHRINETATHEAIHVDVLSKALGDSATKACTYKFPYSTVNEFLALSRVLEGVGVSAYLGAAPLITSKDYLTVAGSILAVEARHAAVISEFDGKDGAPSAFDTPLGFNQVYSLASPFITSCPSTNPTLPVSAFPALTITNEDPLPGDEITLEYANKSDQYFVHFLNGLNDYPVQLSQGCTAKIPAGLTGTVYVVVSSSDTLSDTNTIAGPAFFDVSLDDTEAAAQSYRRMKRGACQCSA